MAAPAFAAEVEGEAGHEGPLAWHADLSLFSAIVFLIFLAVLTKFAWKPLTAGLDTRERRIRDDIAAAESSRVKAEHMLAEHAAKLDRVQDEVKAILAEARRDAEVARQNIVSAAQTEADATKNRAIHEIERARDQALKELFDTMAGRVADATEHVLGRGLTEGDQQRLIDEALAGFSARPANATRA
ncbi:MAG: F0F1 ATP synthase subunit B [Planctomycetota bacterium]|nr:F0F1 ATP synthase subunit B [Planctomycetaceae bacterium]MDQ3331624.1 F0F1 ATP synthase subunit B [Planctomycetota bacterium]